MFNDDWLTEITKRIFDILLIRHPFETSLGVLFGGIIKAIVEIFKPENPNQIYSNLLSLHVVYWVIIGSFIFNLPALFKRQMFDPSIEQAFDLIKVIKKEGNFSESEIRQMYRKVSNIVLDQVRVESKSSANTTSRSNLGI